MSDPNTPAPQGPGKILLIEDERTNRAILSAYLKRAGYEVLEAGDGAAGWDLLSRDASCDVIVTDRRMPNMDGLTLALKVRNDPRTRHIPIIMQTGATAQEEVLEGIRAGVYYYLNKPYEEVVLLGIVRAAIHDRRQKSLFERRLSRQNEALNAFVTGEFHLRTPADAENVALLLGGAYARPELAASGLYELFMNAVEHGLLGIGYEEKNKLVPAGKWNAEIARRLSLHANAGKKAVVRFSHVNGAIEVTVDDGGPGFDWRPFIEIEPARATQSSGRGIAKATLLSFDTVEFLGNGSKVRAVAK